MQRTAGEGYEKQLSYRALHWPDVQAMAKAEDVALAHAQDTAKLTFAVLE